MAQYTVIAASVHGVPGADANAIAVRLARDGIDLGSYFVVVTNPADLGLHHDAGASTTRPQRQFVAAKILSESIESAARSGSLPSPGTSGEVELPLDYRKVEQRVLDGSADLPLFCPEEVVHVFDV